MALNFPNSPVDGDIYQALGRGWKYNGTASVWEALIRVNTAFDSDDIASGTVNLYQNPENIDDRVNQLLVAGTGITLTYDDVANTLTIDSTGGAFTGLSDTPANFTGAAGQYVRVNATETALEYDTLTTADVSEGANLYYTDARVDTHLNQSTAANGEFLKWNGSDYEWATVPPGYTDSDVNAFLAGGTAGNITTTGYIAGPAVFTIDPAAVGDNTGTVVIAGNLQVDGTQTTINSTELAVDDINITIASGAANAAAADGAGITIDGASATLTYRASDDTWQFNKIPEYNGAQLMVYGDSIDVLGNVDITTAAPTDGQALIWDNANSKFIPGDSFSQSDFNTAFALKSVNDLSDVDTTGILDAQILRWNNANSKFEPATPVGVLSDLGDVNNTAPTDGQVLKWDNLNSYWAPADDSVATTLGSIGNVNTTSVANNDILYYNNSANEWQVGTVTNANLNLAYTSDQYVGDNTTVDFTIPSGHSVNSVLVILDGLILPPVDYSISGTTLTFTSAPLTSQSIDIRYMPV